MVTKLSYNQSIRHTVSVLCFSRTVSYRAASPLALQALIPLMPWRQVISYIFLQGKCGGGADFLSDFNALANRRKTTKKGNGLQ